MRLRQVGFLIAAAALAASSGCSKQVAAEGFPYTINGVYIGMPDRQALNLLGAPDKALQEGYIAPGVRINFYGGQVSSAMGQILGDDKGIVLRAAVDGPKMAVKKLGAPSETVTNPNQHAYFRQVLVYDKGDQLMVIPIDSKTGKIWAIRLQRHVDGYQDMLEK